MKTARPLLLGLAIWICAGVPTLRAGSPDVPACPIQKAVQLANESLSSRGLDKQYFISNISLEKTAVFEKSRHWSVQWSEPIMREGTKKREVGAKITMEGKLVLLVIE